MTTGLEPALTDRQSVVLAANTTSPLPSVAQVGFEPTAVLVLSQDGRPVAYRAMFTSYSLRPTLHSPCHCPEQESNLQTRGFKPCRSAVGVPGRMFQHRQSSPGWTRTTDTHFVKVLPLPLGDRTRLSLLITNHFIPVVALRIELSATWLSARFRQPARDYLRRAPSADDQRQQPKLQAKSQVHEKGPAS